MHSFTKTIVDYFKYLSTMLHPNSNKITSGFQVLATIKRSDFKVRLILSFDALNDDDEFPKE